MIPTKTRQKKRIIANYFLISDFFMNKTDPWIEILIEAGFRNLSHA